MSLTVLSLTSCRIRKEIVEKTEYVDRCIVDTVIKVESDTASLMALIECDSLGNALIAQLETLQGQRVNVAPQIVYRHVEDEQGKVRRQAYFAIMAVADSLETEVGMLQEQIRRSSSVKQDTQPTTSPFTAFLWGLLAGIITTVLLIFFIKN